MHITFKIRKCKILYLSCSSFSGRVVKEVIPSSFCKIQINDMKQDYCPTIVQSVNQTSLQNALKIGVTSVENLMLSKTLNR